MNSYSKSSWWLYGVGLFIVVVTHIYMLVFGLPAEQVAAHSLFNIFAGILLAAGWLRH